MRGSCVWPRGSRDGLLHREGDHAAPGVTQASVERESAFVSDNPDRRAPTVSGRSRQGLHQAVPLPSSRPGRSRATPALHGPALRRQLLQFRAGGEDAGDGQARHEVVKRAHAFVIYNLLPNVGSRSALLPVERKKNMPAAKPSKASISNAIAAAKAAGLTPTSIRILPDGSFTVDIAAVELNPAANHKVKPSKCDEPPRYGE